MNFSELESYFKDFYGTEKLADIARILKTSPQVINNWKKRNAIPSKISIQINQNILKQKQQISKDSEFYKFFKNLNKTAGDNNSTQDQFNISLFDIIGKIKQNLKTFLSITSIFCFASFVYLVFFASEVFTSTASIIPANYESSVSRMAGMAAQLRISVPNTGGSQ